MDFLFNVLKFGAAWFVGNIFSGSITQIGCCLFCSFPLLKRLKPYSSCINVSRAKKLYRNAVILHTVILALASWAVISFAPAIMQCGFFFAMAFATLIGMGRWGCNETNVSEFVHTIEKFVLPGKDDEAFLALTEALIINE